MQNDIPGEIKLRLVGKQWTEVTAQDWSMIGASIGGIISYMTPDAFAYYVPSLLYVSGDSDLALEMAVDALIPQNSKRAPRGEWWTQFIDRFDNKQRAVIRTFLDRVVSDTDENSTVHGLSETALKTIWFE